MGTARHPHGVHCRQDKRRRGAPRGRPGVGHADAEGRHEASPYGTNELRKA